MSPPVERSARTEGADTSLGRGLDILLILGGEPSTRNGGLGVVRIAEQLGREKSQVSRALKTLAGYGLVDRDPETLDYRLGWRVFTLAAQAGHRRLLEEAHPVCEELVLRLGETAHLSVLDGAEVLTLMSELSPSAVHASDGSGRRTPAHCTAAGRALLLDHGEALIADLLGGGTLPIHGPRSPRDVAELWRRVVAARAAGFAVSDEEFEPGLVSAAAPVRDFRGRIVAALNVSGPQVQVRRRPRGARAGGAGGGGGAFAAARLDSRRMKALERRLLQEVEDRRDDLVELASTLIGFDTTARDPGEPAGEEAALQQHLASRLDEAGLEVDLWEPEPDLAGSVTVPPGFRFEGRPQLLARRPGAGGGRALLLNGHVDVVPPGPVDEWSVPPRPAQVRDGRLFGRGACDMKGGVAAMVVAVEALASLSVPTAGDLLVNTVTDEESTGAGAAATLARGVGAEAGIIPEPTGLDVWTASRGSAVATITVPGRPGHAGLARTDHDPAAAVNAIEVTAPLLGALHGLRDDWRGDPERGHPLVGSGDVVPISIEAGDWLVTHPSSCRLSCHVSFTPAQADRDGLGDPVRREVEQRLAEASSEDAWLRNHPPVVEWSAGVPTAEVPGAHPVVETLRSASRGPRPAGSSGHPHDLVRRGDVHPRRHPHGGLRAGRHRPSPRGGRVRRRGRARERRPVPGARRRAFLRPG